MLIIFMKQQFQNSRIELISHIENKLTFLKQQRDSFLNKANIKQKPQRIKISNYLEAQGNAKNEEKVLKNKRAMYEIAEPYIEVPSKAQVIENRLQAQQKCEKLKELYERKRELQGAGIHENDPERIKKIYQNQVAVGKIKQTFLKNKKKQQQKIQKQKIIQQELARAQQFLQQPKKSSSKASQHTYNQLLQGQEQKMRQYQQLLRKQRLSLVEKEKLLQMTFELIKQYPERVSKKFLQKFLLANEQFCKIFLVTKEEIMRDLKVHATKDEGYLTYSQFYQLVKSIEISNKALKPNLKYQQKQPISSSRKDSRVKKGGSQSVEGEKEIGGYLKKLFGYLDLKREKVVEREKIEIALRKCLLFDEKKMKSTSKDSICRFAAFISDRRKSEGEKKYYKNLDMKYIGMEQLLQLYSNYVSSPKEKNSLSQSNEIETRSNNFVDQVEEEEFADPFESIAQEKPDFEEKEDDFERYGWGEGANEKQHFSQLGQLDAYYKEMKSRYGNEIHWNNHQVYQQDFKKFNQLISQMKDQRNNPLTPPFPIPSPETAQ